MKTRHVYELLITTTDQVRHNLIYSSKRKAVEAKNNYDIRGYFGKSKILCTNITVRTLF